MKIRIKGNSVRFRLTKSEVKTLCEEKRIEEKTEFNDTNLIYAIETDNNIENLNANFCNNKIVLYIPNYIANDWYNDSIITHKNEITLNNGNTLKLLLEKDFVCLDHTDEDQSDNYPNPNKTC